MAEQAADERITGVVASVNDKGLKLEGHDGWYDFSRFRTFSALPARGETVTLTVARGKFINAIGDDAGAQAGAAPRAAAGDQMPWDDDDTFGGDDAPGKGSAAPRPIRQPAPAPPPVKATGRATLKAAALAASAHFHSGKADSTEDAVYETALRFVAFLEDGD